MLVNATNNRITEVKVLHLPTRKTGQANMILPDKSLDIGFSDKPLLAKKAVISWRDVAGLLSEVTVALPKASQLQQSGKLSELVYVIRSGGTVEVHLR